MTNPHDAGRVAGRKMNDVQYVDETHVEPCASQATLQALRVMPRTLLLLACLVWTAAGANILRLGLLVYPRHVGWVNLALTVVVFAVFGLVIFAPLVRKHSDRIADYGDTRQWFWMFVDGRSFVIMAVMMGGGIALRASGLAPEVFIAVFYTGLGAALTLAGLRFGLRFCRYAEVRRSGASRNRKENQ